MSSTRTVVYLHPHFTLPGGAGVYVLETAQRLVERGWRVVVVCLRADKSIVGEADKRIIFSEVGGPLSSSFLFWLGFPLIFLRVALRVNKAAPHVVFAQVFPANWWGFLYKIFSPRTPLLWMCQEPSAFIHSEQWIGAITSPIKRALARVLRPLLRAIDVRMAQHADLVLANSHYGGRYAREVYGFSPDKLQVTHLGVNQNKFHAIPGKPREPFFAVVGRLTRFKNVHVIIDALALIASNSPTPAELHIVGKGEEEEALRSHAKEKRVEERVRFLGAASDETLVNLLQSCTGLILASENEPFGLVAVEAMSCGAPVIACRGGGPSETVLDDISGFLVPAHDPHALAQKMLLLLEKPELRERLSRAALERAADFSWDSVVDTTEGFLTRLIR